MNRSYSLACLLLAAQTTVAQDVHFTSLDATPLFLNPAFTGRFEGSLRAITTYQNERQPETGRFNSFGFSVDAPVLADSGGNYLAVGLQANGASLLNEYESGLSVIGSVAYHRSFRLLRNVKNCDMAIGVQGGYAQRTLATSRYYPNGMVDVTSIYNINYIHDIDTWNGSNYTLEAGGKFNYYVLNTGIAFSQATGPKFSYTIGFAANNLVQPAKQSEKDINKILGNGTAYTGIFGGYWHVGKRFVLKPSALFRTANGNFEIILGHETQYNFGTRSQPTFVRNISLGFWDQSGALVSMAGAQLSNFRLGVGYRHNYLNYYDPPGNGVDGILLQLQYIAPQNGKHKRQAICERF